MTASRTWFGQPSGLTILFLTNMWEQFSYYGMRALLVYYMTRQLMLGQGASSFIYGVYTACAYLTPIAGGFVADRFLGKRRAIILGGSIMAVGHFLMAAEPLFYVALATIAIGNGLFLPSLPSQIDDLYEAGDPRVGWAYNVYYVGVNIGGFLAPLICGTLGELYGWHYGFGAAGVGMVVGLAIYLFGQGRLPRQAHPPIAQRERKRGRFSRQTITLLIAVGGSVTLFRAGYEQVGNTVALWAADGVDRKAAWMTIPMTWFQALNPLLVMVMTPPLLAIWKRRAERGGAARPIRRMAVGAIIVAAAYLLLALLNLRDVPAQWPWLVLFFVLLTLGELHILPTGLGLFARLAPEGLGATTVAAWYLATFTGSLSAGVVGMLWSRAGHAVFFLIVTLLATAASLSLRALDHLDGSAQSTS